LFKWNSHWCFLTTRVKLCSEVIQTRISIHQIGLGYQLCWGYGWIKLCRNWISVI
jgi:hypothetical protein